MRAPLKYLLAALALQAAVPVAALAENPALESPSGSEWIWRGTLYGWFAGLDTSTATSFGDLDTSQTIDDVLSNLDAAFMGTITAQHGPWSLIGDLVYSDLSVSKDTPYGAAFSKAKVSTALTAFSGYAAYRVYEDAQVGVDLGAGFRYFDLALDTKLVGAALPTQKASNDTTWAVPLVAGRVIWAMDDKWFGTAFADYGGYANDTVSYQALFTVGYQFNETWSGQLGWRYMNIEKSIGGYDTTLEMNGPVLGISARF